MAYVRRYLSGQAATTQDISQQAVTEDKIAAGAVSTYKIKDGAVTTEKILDGTVQTGDIQDGAVMTQNLADESVTTPKIKDKAITQAKLADELSGITRPLTPPVATEEIADDAITTGKITSEAVTMAKIGPYAVQESRIAPGAVTKSKIADYAVSTEKIEALAVDNARLSNSAVSEAKIGTGAVTEAKIGPGAVTETKINDGAVTENKISAGAVTETKLGDDSVTEPKLGVAALSLRHMEAYNVKNRYCHDDLLGVGLDNRWRKRFDAGGYIEVYPADDGLEMVTLSGSGKMAKIDFGGKGLAPSLGGKLSLAFRLPVHGAGAKNYMTRRLGLMYVADETSYILFSAEDLVGATPNWYVRTREGGGETVEDTGVAVTDAVQVLLIEWVSDAEVNFYIDGLLVKTLTTNIPSSTVLDPFAEITSRIAAVKWMILSMISLIQVRPAYA